MNWKKHKLLSISAVVFILLIAGEGFLLFKSRGEYVNQKRELKTKLSELDTLNRRKPFPNKENLKLVSENEARIQSFYSSLISTLSANQIESKRIERAQFPTFLKNAVSRLRREAKKRTVLLPSGFPFGFEDYKQGSLPDGPDVERLTSQVQMVETLVRTLYASGIESLGLIEREVFEKEEDVVLDFGSRNSRGRSPEPVKPKESELYSGEEFTLSFTGSDASVWQVLNALAKHKQFVVVTKVELDNPARPNAAAVPLYRNKEMSSRGAFSPPKEMMMGSDPFATDPLAGNSFQGAPPAEDFEMEEPIGDPVSHEKRIVAGRESVEATITVKFYQFVVDDLKQESDVDGASS